MHNERFQFQSNKTTCLPQTVVTESIVQDGQSVWFVAWLVLLEYLVLWWKGRRLPRLHENILSLVYATFYLLTKICIRGLEYGVYVHVWSRYGVFPSLSDSPKNFIFITVLVDFGFYWLHRASHEVTLLWAVHQVHHSSEEFTVSVGLRHSPLQRLFSWAFYIPLAFLGISPSQMLTHLHFSLLCQVWLHTKLVKTVGLLEYVFNTPSHHRVHHGVNKYCIDKNYGGILIIWDRLFGTFESEKPSQEIVYGIINQPTKHNPLYHQVFYMNMALQKARSMPNWRYFMSSLIKGPSWTPGSKWTGWDMDKLDIQGPQEPVADTKATAVTHCYVILHFVATLTLTSHLNDSNLKPLDVFLHSCIVVLCLTSIGMIYESSPNTKKLEMCRCMGGLVVCFFSPLASSAFTTSLIFLYGGSLLLWTLTHQKIHIKFD